MRVMNFKSEEENPIDFRVGNKSVSIPEGELIRFVIRISRKDPTDYYYITYSTTIYYEDIFGEVFYLSVRLWIQESEVIVIEYNDSKKTRWREIENVISREVESWGDFEMRKLESEIKDKQS